MTNSCILEHQLRCYSFFTRWYLNETVTLICAVVYRGGGPEDVLQPAVDVSGFGLPNEKGEEAYASSAAPNCPRACHDSQTENRRGKKIYHTRKCVSHYTPHCSCCIITIQIILGWVPVIKATAGVQCNMQCCRWPEDGSSSFLLLSLLGRFWSVILNGKN